MPSNKPPKMTAFHTVLLFLILGAPMWIAVAWLSFDAYQTNSAMRAIETHIASEDARAHLLKKTARYLRNNIPELREAELSERDIAHAITPQFSLKTNRYPNVVRSGQGTDLWLFTRVAAGAIASARFNIHADSPKHHRIVDEVVPFAMLVDMRSREIIATELIESNRFGQIRVIDPYLTPQHAHGAAESRYANAYRR